MPGRRDDVPRRRTGWAVRGAPQPQQPPPACQKLVALRDETQKHGQALQAAGQKKAPPEESCKLFKAFLAAETKMIKGLEEQSATCGVPPEVLKQVKAGHAGPRRWPSRFATLRRKARGRAARASATRSAPRRWCRTRLDQEAARALSTRCPAARWRDDRRRGSRRRFDRKLGRRLRPRLDAPLSAARPPRPADRLLAPADAVLVVRRTRGGRTPTAKSISGIVVLFFVGAFAMRGAGCTWNDIVDRDLDARVERTRSRPIPSGQVTVAAAAGFLLVQALGRARGAAAVQPLHGLCRLRCRSPWSRSIPS